MNKAGKNLCSANFGCRLLKSLSGHSRLFCWSFLLLMVTVGCQTKSQEQVADKQQPNQNSSGINTGSSGTGIVLHATWNPFTDSKYKFGERWETIRNLKPSTGDKEYSQEELSEFLAPKDASVGDVWRIKTDPVVEILEQLHEGATGQLHHGGPGGSFACLAAENETHLLIRSRTHAQFVLSDGKYVPSQFAGEALIEKSSQKVVALRLFVPARRNNVDLNWHRQPADGEVWVDKEGNKIPTKSTMIADIGYCSQLELVGGHQVLHGSMEWHKELGFEAVDQKFRNQFYKFAEINWLPFENAVAESQKSGKPLHVVALFGVLDDESC